MTVAVFSRAINVSRYGNAKYEAVAGMLIDALRTQEVPASKDLLGDFAVDTFLTALINSRALSFACDDEGGFVAEIAEEHLPDLAATFRDFLDHRARIEARKHQVRVVGEDGRTHLREAVASTFHLKSKRDAVAKALAAAGRDGLRISDVVRIVRTGDMTARKHLTLLEADGLAVMRIDEKAQGHPKVYVWAGEPVIGESEVDLSDVTVERADTEFDFTEREAWMDDVDRIRAESGEDVAAETVRLERVREKYGIPEEEFRAYLDSR